MILDNCNIHHADEVRALVEDEASQIYIFSSKQVYFTYNIQIVCKLVFLPPYSPDLNPIEQAFSVIKAFLCRNWKDESLTIIDEACHHITSGMAWAFFRASGYVV